MYIFRLVSLVMLILIPISTQCYGVEIKYKFKPGYNYHYTTTSKSSCSIKAPDFTSEEKPSTITNQFIVRVINVKKDIAIIDIVTSNGITRRYLDQAGNIVGAPTESGEQIPMFISFPTKDWKVGEKFQIEKTLKTGNSLTKISTQLILKSLDKNETKAEILFKTLLPLPTDKLNKKVFAMKGKITFNLEKGCVEELVCRYNYKLEINNKEIAVKRHLWDISEEKDISLKLINIKEATK